MKQPQSYKSFKQTNKVPTQQSQSQTACRNPSSIKTHHDIITNKSYTPNLLLLKINFHTNNFLIGHLEVMKPQQQPNLKVSTPVPTAKIENPRQKYCPRRYCTLNSMISGSLKDNILSDLAHVASALFVSHFSSELTHIL